MRSLFALLMGLLAISEAMGGFIGTEGDRFVDSEGRQIMLHGVNISEKSRDRGYLSWHGPREFAQMREWGFNCVRLSIFWDGIEPEPGVYDEEYLAGIDQRIKWAKENGIYIILDMHQDLFSSKFGGDGAPAWATMDDGLPDVHKGPTWGTAYFTSAAVQKAFDNFWSNKPAADGIGIQDHFIATWQHVARRYADEPAVVGYDLFNEPFSGSQVIFEIMPKVMFLLQSVAQEGGNEIPDIDELSDEQLMGYFEKIYDADIDFYKRFVDAGAMVSQGFESRTLARFYARVTEAIRQVDTKHIIFFGTNILCNAGVPSGITKIKRSDGKIDPLQAFAPHGYDIVTDTAMVDQANRDRINLIFDRHAETSRRLDIPTVVGEWGAFYGHTNALAAAEMVLKAFDKHLFSDIYWSYSDSREMNDAPYFRVISRPYPAAIAGRLLSCKTEPADFRFSCSWRENGEIKSPTRIYVPALWYPDGFEVDLNPDAQGWAFEPISSGSKNGYLVIPVSGSDCVRGLVIQPKNAD